MKKEEYKSICQAVEAGSEKKVEHHITHQTGKVLSCEGTTFEVETSGEHKHWAMQNCDKSK